MSSALSSAKNRRANQPPVIQPGQQLRQPPQQPQQQPQPQPSVGNSPPTAGLSLQQVIEIYGRRLNQLETFMAKTQSQQHIDQTPTFRNAVGGEPAPSLAQIQDLIHAKIRDYNDQLYSELQPLRDGLQQQSSASVVSEADFSEFHSRCQMLAEEIYQLKDTVLKLQEFTMTVNKQLLEKSGMLDTTTIENDNPSNGLHIPENNELEYIKEEEENDLDAA